MFATTNTSTYGYYDYGYYAIIVASFREIYMRDCLWYKLIKNRFLFPLIFNYLSNLHILIARCQGIQLNQAKSDTFIPKER